MKKRIAALLLFVLTLSLCACGGGSNKAAEAPAQAMTLDECNAEIEGILSKNIGDIYTMETAGNIVTISITEDGMAGVAAEAKNGGEEFVDAWDDLTDSFSTLSESLQKVYTDNGHDLVVMVVLVDDTDSSKILLSVSKGSVLYDVVTGTDTLGMNS